MQYWGSSEARSKELRKRETLKRQDQSSKETCWERRTLKVNEGLAWDPVDDVVDVDDERAANVEIINSLSAA